MFSTIFQIIEKNFREFFRSFVNQLGLGVSQVQFQLEKHSPTVNIDILRSIFSRFSIFFTIYEFAFYEHLPVPTIRSYRGSSVIQTMEMENRKKEKALCQNHAFQKKYFFKRLAFSFITFCFKIGEKMCLLNVRKGSSHRSSVNTKMAIGQQACLAIISIRKPEPVSNKNAYIFSSKTAFDKMEESK